LNVLLLKLISGSAVSKYGVPRIASYELLNSGKTTNEHGNDLFLTDVLIYNILFNI